MTPHEQLVSEWRHALDTRGVEYVVRVGERTSPDRSFFTVILLPQVGQRIVVTDQVTQPLSLWCVKRGVQFDTDVFDRTPPTTAIGLRYGRFLIHVGGWAADPTLVQCDCGASYFCDRSLGWACPRCQSADGDHHWRRAEGSPLRTDYREAAA